MRFSKNILISLIMLVMVLILPQFLYAQELKGAQKEVWQSVEDHWQCLAKKDLEGFLAYIHPQFTGFAWEDPLPINKDSLRKWLGLWLKTTNILEYEVKPAQLTVYDQVVIVHYYISLVGATSSGQVSRRTIRYTTTWMKQKNKWLVIGNHNELVETK